MKNITRKGALHLAWWAIKKYMGNNMPRKEAAVFLVFALKTLITGKGQMVIDNIDGIKLDQQQTNKR